MSELSEAAVEAIARRVAELLEPAQPSTLIDAEAVAGMLGVDRSWVYSETRAGRLPTVHVGRYRRYRRASIEAWIEAREETPAPSRRPGGRAHRSKR